MLAARLAYLISPLPLRQPLLCSRPRISTAISPTSSSVVREDGFTARARGQALGGAAWLVARWASVDLVAASIRCEMDAFLQNTLQCAPPFFGPALLVAVRPDL